ncbi:unnamed protein product, partial [Staurois parvus]
GTGGSGCGGWSGGGSGGDRLLSEGGVGFPELYCGIPDIVNAGSGESRYSECRVRGEQI